MPDPDASTDLDVHLSRERADLLELIDQPPLARIRVRAARRRQRRRAVAGGALLAAAVTVVLAGGQPWIGRPDSGPAPGASASGTPAAEVPIYAGAGITVEGLANLNVPRLAGDITAVEFVDRRHGYLLAQCAAADPCPATAAWTDDGGLTWGQASLPAASRDAGPLELVAFPGGRLVVDRAGGGNAASTRGAGGWASADGGRTWRPATAVDMDLPIPAGPADLLRLGSGAGDCAGTVQIRQPGYLRAGVTLRTPGLGVCWVAPAATADGAWWVGGLRGKVAAVAVTRDRGASWAEIDLGTAPGPVGSVEVTTVGSHAYAVVLGPGRTLHAVFHSADGGRTFRRAGPTGSGGPPGLAGAAVPLLDGRLLVAGTDRRWYVSTDDGHRFTRIEGRLPAVGRLAVTGSGYVAYDLFGGGWAAFSSDGATWRKLGIR